MGEGGGVEPRSVRPYVVALGLLWIVPAVLVLVLHLTLPDHNASGQCTGLGFGCTPAPADAVVFFGYLAAAAALPPRHGGVPRHRRRARPA